MKAITRLVVIAKKVKFDQLTLQQKKNILYTAQEMLDMSPELSPTSALKQAASDAGIQFGPDMGKFVSWAQKELTK